MAQSKTNQQPVTYSRTKEEQLLYDVCCSSMSAAAVARKWEKITREQVLKLRKKIPELRPSGLKDFKVAR